MKKTLLLSVLALAGSVVGVASAASQAGEAARSTLTTRSSAYGRILFDGRGRALYAFTRDPRGRSVCRGACAVAWPPYIVKRPPAAGPGVRASLLGTTRRSDGKLQVTYAGRPLYYYVRDVRAGQVTCQNVFGFGGLWLVIRPNGRVVR